MYSGKENREGRDKMKKLSDLVAPEMSDTDGWARYYANRWEEVANDESKPEWLRGLAKAECEKWMQPL